MMEQYKPQFLIAAPHSGSGKTTVTLGLLRALTRRGLSVQPYKCGPDYIDTFHHGNAAGRPSVNLDSFMASKAHVRQIYAQHLGQADIGITEGVMGLFDGSCRADGSSAEIAEMLELPVILVVSAKAMAYSAAALLYGFSRFNPRLKIAGVIFNNVNSASHYQFLKDACHDVGLTSLGYLPRNERIAVPSRHLGLCISDEHDYEAMIAAMADHIEQHLELEQLLAVTACPQPRTKSEQACDMQAQGQGRPRIAVARDAAFNFTYHQSLTALEQLGEVSYFSPLADHQLPEADLIYLAGGYPELHLQTLSANHAMRKALHGYAQAGGRILAECGGMMYLSREIIDGQGRRYPMVGALGHSISLEKMQLSLGYRKVGLPEAGLTLRGHEFHYSQISKPGNEPNIAQVKTARDKPIESPVWRVGNLLASYIHFYWGEDAALPRWLLEQGVTSADSCPEPGAGNSHVV